MRSGRPGRPPTGLTAISHQVTVRPDSSLAWKRLAPPSRALASDAATASRSSSRIQRSIQGRPIRSARFRPQSPAGPFSPAVIRMPSQSRISRTSAATCSIPGAVSAPAQEGADQVSTRPDSGWWSGGGAGAGNGSRPRRPDSTRLAASMMRPSRRLRCRSASACLVACISRSRRRRFSASSAARRRSVPSARGNTRPASIARPRLGYHPPAAQAPQKTLRRCGAATRCRSSGAPADRTASGDALRSRPHETKGRRG